MGKDNKKLDKLNQANLDKGLRMRAKCKAVEDDLKVLKAEANSLIEPAMAMLDITSYVVEGVGRVTVKEGARSSINRELLIELMLLKGISVGTTQEIVSEATKVSTYTSVEYRVK